MRDGILGQSFHKNSIKFRLVKVECFGLGEILEEVVDFLVVYLQEGAVNSEFWLRFFVDFYLLEQFVDGSGDQSCEVFIC